MSIVRPDSDFFGAVEAKSGEPVSACYQCRKCTNGCPLAFAMDVMPNQVMRMIQLGLREEVLQSHTIWICASCQTCTTRCPNDIDIAHVMDTLRQLSMELGVEVAEPNVVKFHKAFLDSLRRHGRVFELGMVGRYKLATMDLFSDAALAWEMLKRGKLKFLPAGIQGKREVRAMFDRS
ncbi:MAG TPA: heterodisulfide reductase subunit C [Planctomycetaceae bacterium]|nr:heterodisulfide reductase subunit C [Planctomycetaceae bacterium]